MIVSALVRSKVVRKPISITSPSTFFVNIQSPTLKGLSISTVIAPKKLEIVSLAARARARPEIPIPAIRVAKLKSRALAINIAPKMTIKKRNTLSSALISVFSVPSKSSSSAHQATTAPINSTSFKAQAKREPNIKSWDSAGNQKAATFGIITNEESKFISMASCALNCQNKAAAAATPKSPRLSLIVFAASGEIFVRLLKRRLTNVMAINLTIMLKKKMTKRRPIVP